MRYDDKEIQYNENIHVCHIINYVPLMAYNFRYFSSFGVLSHSVLCIIRCFVFRCFVIRCFVTFGVL